MSTAIVPSATKINSWKTKTFGNKIYSPQKMKFIFWGLDTLLVYISITFKHFYRKINYTQTFLLQDQEHPKEKGNKENRSSRKSSG